MTAFVWLQIGLYLTVLLLLVKPLGSFMARVYQGERTFLSPVLGPVERLIYRITGVNPKEEMGWKTYAFVMLMFSMVGLITLYGLQRL
jgi:potassium-transporting ATPase potassium-binding subunit